MPTLEIKISELMDALQDGVRALVPVFERACLEWREGEAYDPWEKTSEALFQGLVGSAVDCGVYDEPIFGLPTYDARLTSYSNYSYISDGKLETHNAFVCFVMNAEPFDACLFMELDSHGNVLRSYRKVAKDVNFVLVPRSRFGDLKPQKSTIVFEN